MILDQIVSDLNSSVLEQCKIYATSSALTILDTEGNCWGASSLTRDVDGAVLDVGVAVGRYAASQSACVTPQRMPMTNHFWRGCISLAVNILLTLNLAYSIHNLNICNICFCYLLTRPKGEWPSSLRRRAMSDERSRGRGKSHY